jgi:putative resolvase
MYLENQLKTSAFAELLDISVNTLQRLDREGVIPAHRTDTDRRYYYEYEAQKYIEIVTERKLKSHKT